MDELARGSAANRSAVFAAAAAEVGRPVHIIEKDFWVCWILRRLFDPPLVQGMVFKGGTSLSKGYDAIKRFSEDVDLTLPSASVPGWSSVDLAGPMSGTKRRKAMAALKAQFQAWCAGEAKQAVEMLIATALGGRGGWKVEVGGVDGDTLFFHYPKSEDGYGYIAPQIRLEFGAKMPVVPWEEREVWPLCSTAGEFRMPHPMVKVRLLAPSRTFWEKVTLIHAANNRPPEKLGKQVSRHYSDVATLWAGEIGREARRHLGLLTTVAREKALLYSAGGADYSSAAAGRLRMVPPESHLAVLRDDHRAMREMYFEDPLGFEVILDMMREIESTVRDAFGR